MNDTREEQVQKLIRLYSKLGELKRNKKAVMKEYSDEIKDIEDEINEVVKELKGDE